MMVTGDYHYTATSVARRAAIIPPDARVLLIQAESEFRSLHADSELPEPRLQPNPLFQDLSVDQSKSTATAKQLSETSQLRGACGMAKVWGGRELEALQEPEQHSHQVLMGESEVEDSVTGPPQRQLVDDPPLRGSEGETAGGAGQANGWWVRRPFGGGERDGWVAQGSAISQGGTSQGAQGAERGQDPQWHPQEALGPPLTGKQRLSPGAPGQLVTGHIQTPCSQLVQRSALHYGRFCSKIVQPYQHSTQKQQCLQLLQQQHDPPTWHPLSPAGPPQASAGHPHLFLCQQPQSPSGHHQFQAGHPQWSAGLPRTPERQPTPADGLREQLCLGFRVTLEGKETAFHGEDAVQALANMAQGRAHCCVTGPAFEHMLQQTNLSVLHAVMQSVVVFARMQSHQKGQVMQLVGVKGLHLVVHGQQRHIKVGVTDSMCAW